MKAIMVEKAELDLNRTEIISSAKGRVLKLFASPGKRLMQQMDMPEASTAITLYNEERLQARIDVPIADVSKLLEGQKVEITCSMLPRRTLVTFALSAPLPTGAARPDLDDRPVIDAV